MFQEQTSSPRRYAVYYRVFGSLAGGESLYRDEVWGGPYDRFQEAVAAARALRERYENDLSFTVGHYREP